MKRAAIVVAILACAFAASCGKTSETPSPTVSGLALSPATDLIKIKGTEKFSATATFTSGNSEVVTASWASDNQAIATVDATGTVTGVASGQAAITATFQGKSATRSIRIVPDYSGQWAGSWAVTSCGVQGDFPANWCDPVRGGTFPATLAIVQTRDVVSATWTFQESTGTHPGSIGADGRLTLTGSTLQNGVTVTISSWQTLTTDNKNMTGTFALTWTTAGRNGSAQTTIELRNFTKQ